MVKKICLDSDVLIDLLKGKKEVIKKINKFDAEYYATSINVFELWMGKKNKETIFELISTLKILDFSKKSGFVAADIKNKLKEKGEDLDIRDIFIASVCIEQDIELITNNKKHFQRLKKFGLKIL